MAVPVSSTGSQVGEANEAVVRLAGYAAVLVGRDEGAQARAEIELIAAAAPVVVDLHGVQTMSGSFADELFGKLDRALTDSGRVRFEGLVPSVELLATYVRANRERLAR